MWCITQNSHLFYFLQKSDDFRKCAVKVVDIESCCPGRYYYLHNEDNHEDLVVLRKTSKSKNIRKTNGMIFDHTGCVMDEQHSYHHHYENNDKFEVDIKEKIAIPKEVLVLNQLGSHPNLPQLICWYAIPGGYTLVLPRYEMLCELKRGSQYHWKRPTTSLHYKTIREFKEMRQVKRE